MQGYKRIKLLLRKTYKESQKCEDETEILIDDIVEIMKRLNATHDVSTMIETNGMDHHTIDEIVGDKSLIQKCIYEPNFFGKYSKNRKRRAEVFFEVYAAEGFQQIIDNEDAKNYMIENNIWMEHKFSKNEHTIKIGFLTNMYVTGASTKWYNDMIVELLGVENNDIEVSKKITLQRKYNSKVIEVKTLKSNLDRIDAALCASTELNKNGYKYVSYVKTSTDQQYKFMTNHNLLNLQ